jgi:hypothetical protein
MVGATGLPPWSGTGNGGSHSTLAAGIDQGIESSRSTSGRREDRVWRKTMVNSEAEQQLGEPERKAIFLALVEAQDGGDNVLQSRKAIAARFKISDSLVRRIEREGIDSHWPPLD